MKNLMKLLPLVALTLLVSCGGGSKITKEEADCLVNNGGASCVEVEPTPEPTPEPTGPAAGWESILEIENGEELFSLWGNNKKFYGTTSEGYFISSKFGGQGSRLHMELSDDGSGLLEKITDGVATEDHLVEWNLSATSEEIEIRVTSSSNGQTYLVTIQL